MPQSDEYLIKILLQVQGDKQLKTLTTNLEKTAKQAPRVGRAMKTASAGTKVFGRNIQNASFQLTDFIVQVQGGTSATRAFSQQAPQLLAGFGALGAAIGVVAAVLPAMIAGLAGATKGSASLDEQIEKLAKDVSALGDTVSRLDMAGWIKSFNEMDAQARLLATSILEIRLQAAQLNFQNAVDSFTSFADALLPAGRLAEVQLNSIASNLGLSVGALEQLIPLVREFRDDPFGSPQVLEEIVELIKTGGVNAEPLLKRLQDIKAAQESIQSGSIAAGQAAEAGGSGIISTATVDQLKEVEVLAKRVPNALIDARIAANDLEQAQQEFLQAQYDLQIQYGKTAEAAVESFSLQDEAAKIFESTFETAFNGVAMGTQTLSDAFENMAKVIIAQLLKIAAQQAIIGAFGGATGGGFGQTFAEFLGRAKGGAFNSSGPTAFAKGGTVNAPTMFAHGGGFGVMGEAGPEAIVPLSRSPNGNLGVESSPVNVVVNNNAPGVGVRTSQGENGLTIDIVMQQISTAISKGGNSVANALEESYSLGRGRAVY